jgi:zinc transport system permease protein
MYPLSVLLAWDPGAGLGKAVDAVSRWAPPDTFFNYSYNLRALLALVLVSITCGAVGSLVVGGRMAFFSDALAHCAFAGVSIGFLFFELVGGNNADETHFWEWVTPVMVAFGILVGCGIVLIRSGTGLASDTVIGVFFSGSIGLAAMLRKLIHSRLAKFSMEDFLFGDPLTVSYDDVVILAGLTALTLVVLACIYNHLLLTSFNSSLARSRNVPVSLANYLFVGLLAVIVNLCLRSVGALLINALLIVPAATAVNVSRNLRQLFWLTIAFCLFISVAGQGLSWEVQMRTGVPLGIPGTIVLVGVGLFVVSALVGPWVRGRQAA